MWSVSDMQTNHMSFHMNDGTRQQQFHHTNVTLPTLSVVPTDSKSHVNHGVYGGV